MLRDKAHRRAAGLLMASAALVMTAACGGGDEEAIGDGGNGQNNAFPAYTDCLKENGVTITRPSGGPAAGGRPAGGFPSGLPRPSGSAGPGGFPGGGGFGRPDGVDDATWQKAQEACSSLRPSGRPDGGTRNGNGRNAAYQNCLKENGVADPASPDTTDATVEKAIETCQVLRPSATPSA